MSRTLDLLSGDFPHGTPDGYRQGCHGSACPAAMSCRDVHRRYSGDYGFKRAIDAGRSAADLLAEETAALEAARAGDKAAARAQRRAALTPAKTSTTRQRVAGAPGGEHAARGGLLRDKLYLAQLHAWGYPLADVEQRIVDAK